MKSPRLQAQSTNEIMLTTTLIMREETVGPHHKCGLCKIIVLEPQPYQHSKMDHLQEFKWFIHSCVTSMHKRHLVLYGKPVGVCMLMTTMEERMEATTNTLVSSCHHWYQRTQMYGKSGAPMVGFCHSSSYFINDDHSWNLHIKIRRDHSIYILHKKKIWNSNSVSNKCGLVLAHSWQDSLYSIYF